MKRQSRRKVRPEKIIGQTSSPVFWVSPDRRIAFFNSAFEKLTGWPADEVVGQLCEYVADPRTNSLESLAASLCPPAEAFAGQIVNVRTLIPCRTEDPQQRCLGFLPLFDADGILAGILGVATSANSTTRPPETDPAHELHSELASLRVSLSRRFGTQSLVCQSEGMLRVAGQLTIARSTQAAVLIWGEKGVGKEHLARAIHYESDWRARAFVPLDCKALSTLELEQAIGRLFGPSRDEEFFDSPTALRPGTIFLTHVECLTRDVQKTVVEGIRAQSTERAKLRLIASTTVQPSAFDADERMRSDFYHLITHLCIAIPPLRRRMEDLRLLAQHLLEELNRGESRQFNGFGEDVWDRFAAYNWPGNVDELLAVLREARAACNEPLIRAKDLPFRFRTGLDSQSVGPPIRPQIVQLESFLAQAEKAHIEQALKECDHNKAGAAILLGLSRPRLCRRMRMLGIDDQRNGTES
jgi:two-component system, NtrC family, response regulator HydG